MAEPAWGTPLNLQGNTFEPRVLRDLHTRESYWENLAESAGGFLLNMQGNPASKLAGKEIA